tara:strand:+ start:56704 stop:57138 length:435 start_codon:yes stop_codon:yes gene_type:complete
MQGYDILNLGSFFIFGSLLAVLKFDRFNSITILISVSILACLGVYFEVYLVTKHLLLPVLILSIGFLPIPVLRHFGKFGDAFYGIYIYGFPIQQALMYFFELSTVQLMAYSVILSIFFGYLSWHFVEKPALRFKNKSVRSAFEI